MKPCLVILAAGTGTRYGGLKQLEAIGPNGEALLDYAIHDALQAGFGKFVLVVRKEIHDEVKAHCDKTFNHKVEIEYAIQTTEIEINGEPTRVSNKPFGTGHAVLSTRSAVNTPFAVLNADDYYGPSAFTKMSEFLTGTVSANHYAMIGYPLGKTLSDNGPVSRGVCKTDNGNTLLSIDEHLKIPPHGHGMPDSTLVSMNFWGFHPSIFEALRPAFEEYVSKERYNEGEFILPVVINQLIATRALQVSVIPSDEQWYGITYAADKAAVQSALQHKACSF